MAEQDNVASQAAIDAADAWERNGGFKTPVHRYWIALNLNWGKMDEKGRTDHEPLLVKYYGTDLGGAVKEDPRWGHVGSKQAPAHPPQYDLRAYTRDLLEVMSVATRNFLEAVKMRQEVLMDLRPWYDCIVISGHLYRVGAEEGKGVRAAVRIEATVDVPAGIPSRIETNNLLHGGAIPYIFRDLLTDNAIFVTDKGETGPYY